MLCLYVFMYMYMYMCMYMYMYMYMYMNILLPCLLQTPPGGRPSRSSQGEPLVNTTCLTLPV